MILGCRRREALLGVMQTNMYAVCLDLFFTLLPVALRVLPSMDLASMSGTKRRLVLTESCFSARELNGNSSDLDSPNYGKYYSREQVMELLDHRNIISIMSDYGSSRRECPQRCSYSQRARDIKFSTTVAHLETILNIRELLLLTPLLRRLLD